MCASLQLAHYTGVMSKSGDSEKMFDLRVQGAILRGVGRVTQRKSAILTRLKSLVRTQSRPLLFRHEKGD